MYTSFQVRDGYAPKEGPKVVPVIIPFSASLIDFGIDLLVENTNGEISFIQSIYIDNKDNASPLTVTIPVTQQRIVCPSGSQGVFPIYGAQPFQAIVSCAGQNTARVHLCNFPQPYGTWISI